MFSANTQKILNIFTQISAVPHCSKNEGAIRQWLLDFAKKHELVANTDKVGNVLIKVPASPQIKNSPCVVIQGHMDMVCEKMPDSNHNFCTDPLELIYDGDWLSANKTTLGADNGIALAIGLALATDNSLSHPPLELLFTVDEETGLTGALALEPDFINGKILLNIDSDCEGIFTVGCAGGRDSKINFPLNDIAIPSTYTALAITVGGLKGGHSGGDINKNRGNAIIIVARILKAIHNKCPQAIIGYIAGGSAHNAIARDAKAVMLIPDNHLASASKIAKRMSADINNESRPVETELVINIYPCEYNGKAFAETDKLIDLLLAIPHGVYSMSTQIKGVVETSANLATAKINDDCLEVLTSQRGSVASKLNEITQIIEIIAKLAGANVISDTGYPAWEPNWDSQLLAKCQKTYLDLFKKEAIVKVIHAGLECGIIGSKKAGMDMISLGPTINDLHSPDEKLKISDLDKVWDFLVALLKTI